MKALMAIALIATSTSAFAVGADEEETRKAGSDRRICTRVEQRNSSSRLTTRRICATEAEWRERLGPDWRQQLAGRDTVEDDIDAVDARTRAFSDVGRPD